MTIGRFVKVQSHGWASNRGLPVVALDEFGQCWCTGEWAAYSPALYYNRDNSIDFQGGNDYTTRFVKMYNQIEPFIDFCFYNRNSEGENAIMAIGESGQIYVMGYGGWNNLGNLGGNSAMDGWITPQNL